MDVTDQDVTQYTRWRMPDLRGGTLCLDFANTVDPRYGGTLHEYLSSSAALVAWSRHAELLTEAEGHDLIATAQRRPREAEDVLQ